jgi:hypothetical protein
MARQNGGINPQMKLVEALVMYASFQFPIWFSHRLLATGFAAEPPASSRRAGHADRQSLRRAASARLLLMQFEQDLDRSDQGLLIMAQM